MILGIDEVGRGPWAGPLVVGAVVLGGVVIDGLTDSKKLSKKQRERLDIEIREKAAGFGLGWVSANEIDEIGLSQALALATKRAVKQIATSYNEIVIDGTTNFLSGTNKEQYVTTMKKADLLVPSVSAASIVAKVARDNYMILQDDIYPGYGFKRHVGYGTATHRAAINKLGVTPLHRLSVAPLKKYASQKPHIYNKSDIELTSNQNVVTTKVIGDTAEDVACDYLVRLGHKILNRNWKTKYCEIDIVSKKGDTIYFTEVKYRKTNQHGDGLEVITRKKISQMKFAAKFFAHYYELNDNILCLTVMSIANEPPMVVDFIEI
jgi:ribonuclease HII